MNNKSVRERLGKEAWDILIEKSDDGTISDKHMKDISRELGERIGGNHSRRVNERKAVCDGSEMREILSDWWEEELYKLHQTEALGKISDILRKPEVNLPSVAFKLRPWSGTDPLDAILGTGILENEPRLEQKMKKILESMEDSASAGYPTPKEAYDAIDFYFAVTVKNFKSNNLNVLQFIEQVEHETESSFQLENVKQFILGEGTLNTERLQKVETSRLKLLIMQILEEPSNKRRVRQMVSQYKKDIATYMELKKNHEEKEGILSRLKELEKNGALQAENEAHREEEGGNHGSTSPGGISFIQPAR